MRSLVAPTRRGAITLLRTLWQITSTAAGTFLWGALRDGAIDLRLFGRALRLIAASGLLLIFGFLFSILFNDLLRINGPLELLNNDSTATRGLLVPRAAIPITLLAITLGWGYALVGALHARPALRWSTLLAYVVFAILPLSSQLLSWLDVGVAPWVALILLALLLIDFLVLPRVALPLPLEWSLVLASHGALLLLALLAAARQQSLASEPWVSTLTSSLVGSHLFFIAPFLMIAGLGWADFGLEASGWAVKAVRRHATTAIVVLLLLALLSYRLYGRLSAIANDGVDARQWGAWAGAALFGAGLAPIARWRGRQAPGGDVPRRLLVTLAVLVLLAQILVATAVDLVNFGILLQPFRPELLAQATRLRLFLVGVSELEYQHRPLLLACAGLLIAWVARQRAPTLAAYAMILACSQTLAWLTRTGRPLAALQYAYADVDTLGLLALTALALIWLLRRRLTGERALRLLGLALLMALLNQTAFLDNPFSPLFGFAGVFFLVFGIVWSILTAGGPFVNQSSPGLPRDSRLLLYIGYVLLSVSVAHWYLVSHNIAMQAIQGTLNTAGFLVLGLPLAYLALVEGGERLLRHGEGEE
jgi:hypothetical protein